MITTLKNAVYCNMVTGCINSNLCLFIHKVVALKMYKGTLY